MLKIIWKSLEKNKMLKDCPYVEKYYSIDEYGNIYNKKSGLKIKAFKSRIGYYDVYLYDGKSRYIKKLHRLVALAFLDKKDFKEVNHIDGDKSNNHFSNLEWTSRSENMKHAMKKGLLNIKKGEKNSSSKLLDIDIVKIRNLYKNGVCIKNIAKDYKVCYNTIWSIIKNLTWKHIKEN